METVFIEATNVEAGGINWGKFMIGRFTSNDWEHKAAVSGFPMLQGRGWTSDNLLVLDLETGEGAIFRPGGSAAADLHKHQIWVCPMFEPFLEWLYRQDLTRLEALPKVVQINDRASSLHGYRRPGAKGTSNA